MAERKPTIIDVARAAGASIKTVSRVMNNERYVSAETRERVMKAMAELQFQPNRSAQSLKGDRSYLIAHIYGDPGGPYTGEIQMGLLNRCRQQGYHLLIEEIDYSGGDVQERVSKLVHQLNLDGVVLTAPVTDNEAVMQVLDEAGVPYIRVTPATESPSASSVRIDERAAAADLTLHLLAFGHRRIGFIKGRANHAGTDLRYGGYCDALREYGLEPEPEIVEQGGFTYRSALAGARRLLSLADPPTAIFASNDEMAAGVLSVAHDRGLSLPSDLSVVGFDDIQLSEMVWPPLTTVRQPIQEMADAAAEVLIDLLAHRRQSDTVPPPIAHRVLPHKLVIRRSTAPPAKR
ncbi:LacI family DNA-binding transcriptional regulator [Niveispirillum irakense]|uniref:LacI family DNA-binding transcriptional regulator n=1 Tax=Niveispirillum irakense TaxID=34011 RepID=UPI0003F7299F|nr:LacI family DNA-binding transcriptional regulator [Niveispirillum irakense]